MYDCPVCKGTGKIKDSKTLSQEEDDIITIFKDNAVPTQQRNPLMDMVDQHTTIQQSLTAQIQDRLLMGNNIRKEAKSSIETIRDHIRNDTRK